MSPYAEPQGDASRLAALGGVSRVVRRSLIVRFVADLHIHSKYSRACSKDADLEHLAWWARRKGVTVVGTGDFTHPAWFDHLTDTLVPAEPGLFRLRDDLDGEVLRRLPASCHGPVRFMLSVEISTIYRRDDRTRKVHHLLYVPTLEAAARVNRALARIGNLGSDGRPILGLDSRDLLEITLESDPGSYLVPAHIWTPWFAAMGSRSGFDTVDACYADLAPHVFAVETGLSSDPPMNWRVSSLDRFRLVSSSDAHSPPMLAREASVFDTDLDYVAMRRALETGAGYEGTIEFFPEHGKYHLDGHRKCDVRLEPEQTRAHDGGCPSCGKPLTVGVLHRVEELADRPDGARPPGAADFTNLVPLPEILGEILGVGPKSKRVARAADALVARLGPELAILRDVPLDDVARAGSSLLAEALGRLRRSEVIRDAGYDGEYGAVRLFTPGELDGRSGATALFDVEAPPAEAAAPAVRAPVAASPSGPATPAAALPAAAATLVEPVADGETGVLAGLDPDQRRAAAAPDAPLLVVAGPGTGKTRTLTHRIAHLLEDRGVPPEQCLALTFTRRAAAEMAERLAALVPEHAARLTVTTFHGLGARIVREQHERLGLPGDVRVADEAERLVALDEAGVRRDVRAAAERLSRHRRAGDGDPETAGALARYQASLRARGLVDFDDLVALPVRLLETKPEVAEHYRERHRWIVVDEYQDVDALQYRLLRLLAGAGDRLTVIGDPDQAIYRFRGADVGFFLRFHDDHPGAQAVTLTRNYRSSPAIVEGALHAVRPSTLVADRVLVAATPTPDPARITLHDAADEDAEGGFVAATIDRMLGGSSLHSLDSGRADGHGVEGLSFADFAVLYRTDAQSRPIMEALTRAGVPFQRRSHDPLTGRPGVQQIAHELRFASGGGPVAARVRAAAAVVAARMPSHDEERRAEIHAAVDLLLPLAERSDDDLDRFLTELALGAEVDTWDPRADRVSLLTLHAAKGLEFPVVFVVGCDDGTLPLRLPGRPEETDVDEERRLFFVGMTRARRRLVLSRPRRRVRLGTPRDTGPSPFLASVPSALVEREGALEGRRARRPDRQLRLEV